MDVGQSIQAGNWLALFTYMGFSFFAGYVIGFATRTFLKLAFFALICFYEVICL